ncbi:hypothetical protein ACFLST_01520 [Chloroflexota bacterium]
MGSVTYGGVRAVSALRKKLSQTRMKSLSPPETANKRFAYPLMCSLKVNEMLIAGEAARDRLSWAVSLDEARVGAIDVLAKSGWQTIASQVRKG